MGECSLAGHALGLMYSESPVEEHPRLHRDLLVDTSHEQLTEIARLVELGAHQVDWNNYPAEADFVVLADPDGNRSCAVDLSK